MRNDEITYALRRETYSTGGLLMSSFISRKEREK